MADCTHCGEPLPEAGNTHAFGLDYHSTCWPKTDKAREIRGLKPLRGKRNSEYAMKAYTETGKLPTGYHFSRCFCCDREVDGGRICPECKTEHGNMVAENDLESGDRRCSYWWGQHARDKRSRASQPSPVASSAPANEELRRKLAAMEPPFRKGF